MASAAAQGKPYHPPTTHHCLLLLLVAPRPPSRTTPSCRNAGIIRTSPEPDHAGHHYVGCFADDDDDHVFSGKKYVDAHMTNEVSTAVYQYVIGWFVRGHGDGFPTQPRKVAPPCRECYLSPCPSSRAGISFAAYHDSFPSYDISP